MLGTLGGAQGSHVRGQGEFAVRPGGQKQQQEENISHVLSWIVWGRRVTSRLTGESMPRGRMDGTSPVK
jgi:hypothetical protein